MNPVRLLWLCASVGLGACLMAGVASAATINIGSKRFTESYILGEILRQKAASAGEATATHQ